MLCVQIFYEFERASPLIVHCFLIPVRYVSCFCEHSCHPMKREKRRYFLAKQKSEHVEFVCVGWGLSVYFWSFRVFDLRSGHALVFSWCWTSSFHHKSHQVATRLLSRPLVQSACTSGHTFTSLHAIYLSPSHLYKQTPHNHVYFNVLS